MQFSNPNTQYVGKSFVHYARCDSTNRVAQQLLQKNQAHHGTIVHADFQTAGRGQQRSHWESDSAQNLTFSLILFPQLAVDQQYWLTIAISLALCDTLNPWLDRPVAIKWPNDILCESSKMCGILIQNNLKGRMIHSAVIGIGLNVNQDEFTTTQATSLSLRSGRYWDRSEVLRALTRRIEHRWEQLRRQEYTRLKSDYLVRMYWRGESHTFEDTHGVFHGTIVGIDETGRLAVEVDERIRYYDTKELIYRF